MAAGRTGPSSARERGGGGDKQFFLHYAGPRIRDKALPGRNWTDPHTEVVDHVIIFQTYIIR
jgi:hypothetical protein